MKYRYLSHPIKKNMPVYGGRADIGMKSVRAISNGDTSNMYTFAIGSHWGTHVDAPRHFFENGMSIEDYPAETWIFTNPEVIDVTLGPSEILSLEERVKMVRPSTDMLIFRSGWSHFRAEDKYIYENPGIGAEVGAHLRRYHPYLRAIGIDCISISSYQDRACGRKAHGAFLDPAGDGKPILIVEDMNLSEEMSGLHSIIVSPLIVLGIDSAPCTVLGVFHD